VRNGIQTNGTLLNEEWCRFLAAESFSVGLSLDGPAELHDPNRRTLGGEPTHAQAMRAYELLRKAGIHTDILCVVHNVNVRRRHCLPFSAISAPATGFCRRRASAEKASGVSRTPPAESMRLSVQDLR
jgi:hypothetical protein